MKKLSHVVPLSPDEISVVQDLQLPGQCIRRHRDIVTEGRKYDAIFLLVEGFAVRCRVLKKGGRQVLNVALPGDLIGFPGCFFDRALYSVTALTDAVISPIPHSRILALFENSPLLAAKIFWSFACEAAIYAERLIDIGRRSALERVAHFLLEVYARLEIVGLASNWTCPMPFTQELIGDALGLSVPHVNRTLRQLRDDGFLAIAHQHLIIKDFEAVSALAGFDGAYLGRCRMPDGFKPACQPGWPTAVSACPAQPSRPGSGGGPDASLPR
jgi:CRP-like cAMP-binding protein